MADKGKSLEFTRTINAPVEHLYFAFTTKMGLREWLSASAEIYIKKMNMFSLLWEKDYAVVGTITETVENSKMACTWQGLGDPHPTTVTVTLDAQGEETAVNLVHGGIGAGEEWDEVVVFLTNLWEKSLDNLKQMMETGLDARLYNKPMIGIWLGDIVDPKIAKKKKLTIEYGLIIGGAMKGMGAAEAGLEAEDQIVEIDGIPIRSFADVDQALEPHVIGDVIEMVYYRQGEKQTAYVTLSTRVPPEVPSTAQGLSEKMGSIYASANAKLDEVLYQVSEAQAEFRPAQGEWNSKEVLAHMILNERDTYSWAATAVAGYETYPYSDVLPARLKSTLHFFPQVPDLRQGLNRAQDEGVTFLAEVPSEFVARSSSFVRFAGHLQDVSVHYSDHIGQIETNLVGARDLG